MMEVVLKFKLDFFLMLINKDVSCFYDLFDILDEIEVVKEDMWYFCFLLYFDCLIGIILIVKKLFNDL